jgi:hypothetical protein
MNTRQKITVIAVDICILAELFVGMYAASLDPENFTAAFCKSFFALLAPTLAAGLILSRLMRDKNRPQGEAAQAS